jgi:hypothetical protein
MPTTVRQGNLRLSFSTQKEWRTSAVYGIASALQIHKSHALKRFDASLYQIGLSIADALYVQSKLYQKSTIAASSYGLQETDINCQTGGEMSGSCCNENI